MTKEQRAARKPLLAKIRRLKGRLSLATSASERYWGYYKAECLKYSEALRENRSILNKEPGTKFWMEDQNRALAERKPVANPETCISIPNGGTPPRAPRQ